ncbi:MAG TPA: MarR family transcriptional regulator [Steroidobacteraceae bacterium]|nr:MarR family transcriptional regulator [Steroidobacteraceae bacterium]
MRTITEGAAAVDDSRLIVRAVLQLGRKLRSVRPSRSVSLSTLSILGTLHRFGPMAAVTLAQRERLKPQSLTRLLAAMQRQGLILRRRSETDRRAHFILITAKGRRALGRDVRARRRWLDAAMSTQLRPDERAQLAGAAALMLRLVAFDTDDQR